MIYIEILTKELREFSEFEKIFKATSEAMVEVRLNSNGSDTITLSRNAEPKDSMEWSFLTKRRIEITKSMPYYEESDLYERHVNYTDGLNYYISAGCDSKVSEAFLFEFAKAYLKNKPYDRLFLDETWVDLKDVEMIIRNQGNHPKAWISNVHYNGRQ